MDRFELTYTAEKTAALHALLRDLLDYGAAAQNYMDYNRDNPVNEGVSSDSLFDPEEIESVKASGELVGESGAKFSGATVRFDSAVFLRFDFTLGALDLTEVSVIIGEVEYKAEDFIDRGNGAYSVYTDAIGATDLAKAYTATLKVAGEDAHTVTYSVNSYIKVMYENPEMGELAKALYHYGVSAVAFAAISNS